MLKLNITVEIDRDVDLQDAIVEATAAQINQQFAAQINARLNAWLNDPVRFNDLAEAALRDWASKPIPGTGMTPREYVERRLANAMLAVLNGSGYTRLAKLADTMGIALAPKIAAEVFASLKLDVENYLTAKLQQACQAQRRAADGSDLPPPPIDGSNSGE